LQFITKHRWIIVLSLIMAALFWGSEIRPSLVYRDCNRKALEAVGNNIRGYNVQVYERVYRICLRDRGFR